jgi:hypothetical protein
MKAFKKNEKSFAMYVGNHYAFGLSEFVRGSCYGLYSYDRRAGEKNEPAKI